MQPNQSQLAVMLTVIDRIAPKYTFTSYDVEDIKQEAYIILAEALPRYDGVRPLENFLSKHLSNRLKDLVRNKYSRAESSLESERHTELNAAKKRLMDLRSYAGDDIAYEIDLVENINTDEIREKILGGLSPSQRNDYFRLANGVSIPTGRKASLIKRCLEVLDEDG